MTKRCNRSLVLWSNPSQMLSNPNAKESAKSILAYSPIHFPNVATLCSRSLRSDR
jgi:hypothetical protein